MVKQLSRRAPSSPLASRGWVKLMIIQGERHRMECNLQLDANNPPNLPIIASVSITKRLLSLVREAQHTKFYYY
ncbi:unnamed protein product [Rodentolepis nana]|uniref:Uncharacterized protein n=1 Tax=Rodentolepis nana TaxID=102285 RepID=A0A0R3TY23_RODNA|nr:unnamed protein product [Rodentolepis nana]